MTADADTPALPVPAPSAADGANEVQNEADPATGEAKAGYLIDFVSKQEVKSSPEERDAVQVFSRRLVEDYGYPVEHIQTRPQYRVRQRPSDEAKSYPVDIAVFSNATKIEANLQIVVECKKKTRKAGVEQLKLYLSMSQATLGVWFNGSDHAYMRKVYHQDGSITYEDLPNIPRHGQRVNDIGLYKRRDLKKPSNLKATFRDLRNHLSQKAKGITRDQKLAQEIMNILFCKIYDEVNTGLDEVVRFRAGLNEPATDVERRILDLFGLVKTEYSDVFTAHDVIELDAASIAYVAGELQNYAITEADRDAIGDAFEVFIGPGLRGDEGQFFTPRNVVRMIVDMVDPRPGEMIIDPACGSGGFLINALDHVWAALDAEAVVKGWNGRQLERKRLEAASRHFRGIDKDSFLAKVTKAYMALVGDGRGGIFCENSLDPPTTWSHQAQDGVKLGTFDVVFTNPPFGTKIPVAGDDILSQYELGYKWKKNRTTGELEKSSELHEDQPPQILFIERCLQLLKPGGRMGIVLPESIFGMPTYEYVIAFLEQRARIKAVISMPEALFKTSGKGGTHAKVAVAIIENTPPADGDDYDIFLADAKWCGHDSRGNPTNRIDAEGKEVLLDDVPIIADRYKVYKAALGGQVAVPPPGPTVDKDGGQ